MSVASEHVAQETPVAPLLKAFECSPRSSPEHLHPCPMYPPATPSLYCTAVAVEVSEVLLSLLSQCSLGIRARTRQVRGCKWV